MKTEIEYSVTKDNIHIKDSYKITKEDDMVRVLTKIKITYYSSAYFFYMMPYRTLIDEWKAHNLLYDFHLFRSHTKDADLNKNPWYIKVVYSILSRLYIKSWFK